MDTERKFYNFLTRHFTYTMGLEDIPQIAIKSCTKNWLILEDQRAYVELTRHYFADGTDKYTTKELPNTTLKEFATWLMANGAYKPKRRKREKSFSLYD